MDFLAINKLLHVISAIIGTLSAVAEEVLYFKDIRDGKIDEAEAKQLRITYKVMHIALIVLVLTGFGILAGVRIKYGGSKTFYSPILWFKYTVVIVLLLNAVLISARKMPMKWASAISLTSWLAAYGLGVISGKMREFKWLADFLAQFNFVIIYLFLTVGYLAAVAIMAQILEYIKKLIIKQ